MNEPYFTIDMRFFLSAAAVKITVRKFAIKPKTKVYCSKNEKEKFPLKVIEGCAKLVIPGII